MAHSGVLFILFCTVNCRDVKGLNNEVGLISEVGDSVAAPFLTLTA